LKPPQREQPSSIDQPVFAAYQEKKNVNTINMSLYIITKIIIIIMMMIVRKTNHRQYVPLDEEGWKVAKSCFPCMQM
jgi:hypothetical protein